MLVGVPVTSAHVGGPRLLVEIVIQLGGLNAQVEDQGTQPCSIALSPVPIEGLEIKIKNFERVQMAPGDSLELAGELAVTPLFRAPPLSFSTVVGTVLIEASSLPEGGAFWASVGFERS